MTFTFKLSKRLAQVYVGIAAALTLSACGELSITDVLSGTSEAPVTSITVSPETVTIVSGARTQLAATLLDSAGQLVTERPVTWSSDAPLVAIVSKTGEVQALAEGSATITAESEGHRGSASVRVGGGEGVGARAGYYVAPDGSSGGDGSRDDPWDLASALSGAAGRVQPGDTVWLLGGTYRGSFRTSVRGASGRPVVFRQYPGERAILDGAGKTVLWVSGDHSVFWGFELMNSSPVRSTGEPGNGGRAHGIVNDASYTKYVNLVVHDNGVAFYTDPQFVHVEIAGCIFYNNGWQGPDRGHGHALYLKSQTGPVVVRDNVMFNQFGYGLHVYSNAGSGQMNNIRIEGNVSFNNGTLSTNSEAGNFLVGGDDYSTGNVLQDNVAYHSRGITAPNLRVGWGTKENGTIQLRGNYFAGGTPVLELGYWKTATVERNQFIGADTIIALRDGTPNGHAWTINVHQRDPAARAWKRTSSVYTFSEWRSATGLAQTDQALSGLPTATSVVVRPNPHEAGRAMIVVLNWGRQGSVTAALTGVLVPGDRYEVRNVQKMFGAPVASGTFNGGSVTLPSSGVTPPTPIGLSSSRAPKTGPDFDVFVVTRLP